jgi:hypothetical protein
MTQPPNDPWQNDPQQSGQQPPVPQQPGEPVPPPSATPGGGGFYASPPAYGAPQYGGVPAGPPPDNYLVWAILSTILCCLPLGIVSIVYSSQVNSKWAVGDVAGAHESSAKAKTWATWSAVIGAISIAISVVLWIVLVVAVASTSTTTNIT